MLSKKRVLAFGSAIVMLLLAASIALANTIVYVTPEFLTFGDGNVQWGSQQADGSYSIMLSAADGAAAFSFAGLTPQEILAAGLIPSVLLQSQSVGPVYWEGAIYDFGGGTYVDWGNQIYGPLNDANPFYFPIFPPDFNGPAPDPNDQATFYFYISPGGNQMNTQVWEFCVGRPGGGDEIDGDNGPGQQGEAVCFRFLKPKLGNARIPMFPVAVDNMPTDNAYARTWLGTYTKLYAANGDVVTNTAVLDFQETGESVFYSPWNTSQPENGRIAKASFATPGDRSPAPVIVELHDGTSAVRGTCPTWVMYGMETHINWADCAQGKSFWELVQSGEIEHLYSAQVRTVNSSDGYTEFPVH